MPLRFYRRYRFGPGRLNFSKRGVSYSFGGRGAWVTVGRRGVRTSVGIPGTGLYWTEQRQLSQRRPSLPASPLVIQLPTSTPAWLLILRVAAFAAALAVIVGTALFVSGGLPAH
jgi:Protein of unknown function (DUF4236)